MAQKHYVDQTKDFNLQDSLNKSKQVLDTMKKVAEAGLIQEREMIEKDFPEILWDEHEKKIKEAEKKFPKPERIYYNDELQKIFEEKFWFKQKADAALKRTRNLKSK